MYFAFFNESRYIHIPRFDQNKTYICTFVLHILCILPFNNCFYQDFDFIHNSQYEKTCSIDDEKSQDQLFIYLFIFKLDNRKNLLKGLFLRINITCRKVQEEYVLVKIYGRRDCRLLLIIITNIVYLTKIINRSWKPNTQKLKHDGKHETLNLLTNLSFCLLIKK